MRTEGRGVSRGCRQPIVTEWKLDFAIQGALLDALTQLVREAADAWDQERGRRGNRAKRGSV